MLRDSAPQHHVGQCLEDLVAAQAPGDPDRETFAGIFINQRQQAKRPPVVCRGPDEVVAPDVMRPLRPESHARPVVPPQPAPWCLPGWDLQPLTPPNALHPTPAAPPPAILLSPPGGGLLRPPRFFARLRSRLAVGHGHFDLP